MRLARLPVPLLALPAFLALLALLLLGGSSPAQAPRRGDVVGGKVVDARTQQPLPHALVTLQSLHAEHIAASTYTGDDGQFRFPDPVAPGKYRIEGQASGHLPAAYLEHGQLSTAIVTGAGLGTGNLVLALMPEATISGRVVDENGDPVPHATVSLFRKDTEPGTLKTHLVGSRAVADDGEFEFDPLMPGQYFLAARGTPWYAVHPPQDAGAAQQIYRAAVDPALDVAYPTVFYPEARTADAASPLDLAGGEQITANFRLEPEHAVTLTIRRGPGAPSRIPPQLTESVFGVEMPVPTQTNVNDGLTTLTGLAPGRYAVRDYSGNGRLPTDAGTVDLTGGSVTRDAGASSRRASLTVSLRPLGTNALPNDAEVTLLPDATASEFGPRVSRPVNAKGEAEFEDLPAGIYHLRIATDRQADLPIGAVTLNGSRLASAHLTLSGGDHDKVAVQLSGLAVTVEGFALQGGKPAPACMVVLVPAGGATDLELFRRDQSDMDGSFSLPEVAPGRYLLVALENAWTFAWTDVHALEPYLLGAQPIEIPAGSAATVRLRAPVVPQAIR